MNESRINLIRRICEERQEDEHEHDDDNEELKFDSDG